MTTWNLDSAHTQVNFSAKQMMVTTVRGTFHDVTGTIELDETDPTRSRGAFSVKAASVDTNFGARDTHLRSADFFDVENSGPMTFKATDFDGTTATGELTIKGVTRTVELDVEFLGLGLDPWGNQRLGFEANTVINRQDFGVTFNIPLDGGKVMVGDKVSIHLAVEAVHNQS